MSDLYLDNGYVNFDYLWNKNQSFMLLVGGWGTGKTYGALKKVLETGKKFIYMRRLETALEISSDADGNPFKKLNKDLGKNIQPIIKKNLVKYYECDVDDNGRNIPKGLPIGLGVALSTFSKMRGVDFSDIDYIIYDEFIAMSGERTIKDEFSAFLRFYETVNRNRELSGEPAVKCYMLGNPNTMGNAYFLGWDLVKKWQVMDRSKQNIYTDMKSGVTLIRLNDSPISKRKQTETVLYKTDDEYMYENGIIAQFAQSTQNIKSLNMRECYPIVGVGRIGIYGLRSRDGLYVSSKGILDPYYMNRDDDLKNFRIMYGLLKVSYFRKTIIFENYDCELRFKEYFGL